MARSQSPLGLPLRSLGGSPSNASTSSVAAPPSAVYSTLTPEETASRLQTSLDHGLPSAREAITRRSVQGPNELPGAESDPLVIRFLKQFLEPLILILLGSAVVSFLMRNFDDAISIAIAVLIVVSVGFVQEYKSEKSLEALNQLVPHSAHLVRGRWAATEFTNGATPSASTVLAGQLVPGDLVRFSTGDRIPADVRITKAAELEIDESSLTGENEPVRKGTETVEPRDLASPTLAEIPVPERKCIAFMGTLVRHGHGQGIVIATGQRTEFGTISAMLSDITPPRTPLQATMDKLGKDLSYASFAVIAVIVLVGLWQGRPCLEMFQIGVSLAVAAIPEGLPIIVTVTLALGVMRMVKRGGIVRKLPSVETLGCVSVVCSDKTGTLTMNHMTVTKIWTPDASEPVEKGELMSNPDAAVKSVIRIGTLCNNARTSRSNTARAAAAVGIAAPSSATSRFVGQPTDVALLDLMDAFREPDVRDHFHRVSETPFSSHRKWMGVISTDDTTDTAVAFAKGAPEQVLAKCDTYMTKDGGEVVLDEPRRKAALAASEKMQAQGLRVLGLARGRPSKRATKGKDRENNEEAFSGLCFAGAVGIMDPPRPEVAKSIQRLMGGGVRVVMITGDSEITAAAVARQLGLPLISGGPSAKPVLKGEDLDTMTDEQLAKAVSTTTIFARVSPEHKMKIVRAFQARHDVVAMTGDGVNDAPALKMADIGVAMGIQGTDVAKEAADMVLTDDNFSTMLGAIEEGKGIFYNIQNFLTFQLSTSVAALSLVLVSTFFGLKNPLNPMQILWINILMDGPPAQSLGVEPVDPIVMTRPPRSRNARILTRPVLARILTSATIIMIGTMFVYVREMAADGLVTARDTTMTFTCFVFFDMFNALSCRSEGKSVLRGEVRLFGNGMFNYAVAGSLIGQMAVVYIPWLQNVFQTEALGVWDLIFLVGMCSSVFLVDEGRKFLNRGEREWSGRYSASV